MEHGPLKRYWTRWPTIIFLFAVGVLGCLVLHAAVTDGWLNTVLTNDEDFAKYFVWSIGILFTLFGFIGSVTHFLSGLTYYRHTKIPFDDLEYYRELNYGFLVVYNDEAKIIRYNHGKIRRRQYIKGFSTFDRHKNIKSWALLET